MVHAQHKPLQRSVCVCVCIFMCVCDPVPLKQPEGECVPHSEAVKRRLTRVEAEYKHN